MDKFEDVVLTTRIRFARNIKGKKFTNNMSSHEKEDLLLQIKDKLKNDYNVLRLSDIDDVTKKSLVETHTISKELINENYSAIIHDEKNNIVIMINEEDHFRIQAFANGFDTEETYRNIKEADKIISKNIEYAINKDYGYITACPTCIGTGMRVSVMLHLPSLEKIHALDRVFSNISNLGIAIRGMYGENSNSECAIYQISNQKTIGMTEEDIIKKVNEVTSYLVKQERKAREMLETRIEVKDDILRSYGILKYAELVSKKEAMRLLSNIYLGINMKYINDIKLYNIKELMEEVGINTLRKKLKDNFSIEEENIKRAEYIKSKI